MPTSLALRIDELTHTWNERSQKLAAFHNETNPDSAHKTIEKGQEFMSHIIVIGGGAAGMMAALTAAEMNHAAGPATRVTLLEKNEKLGKKIYITGKGRCNFTNACDFNTFISNVVTNPKFMYSSLRAFGPEDMIGFLEESGCPTKVERGNRAFPESDHASDVTAALARRMKAAGVEVHLETEVLEIRRSEDAANVNGAASAHSGPRFQISAKEHKSGRKHIYEADAVIIATGGLSYPSTGSTGDGYRFAADFGLESKSCSAALVPLETKEEDYRELQGVSLKNVSVKMTGKEALGKEVSGKAASGKAASGKEKVLYDSEPGELLFTHFGLSGPLILTASSIAAEFITERKTDRNIKIFIDLKPALTEEMLDARILRDFEEARNQNIENALGKLLISSLRPVILRRAGIRADKKVRDITKEERAHLVQAIKHLDYTVTGTRGYNEAIVTHGGVAVSEINPKTMESRKVRGLYFAGEVLDVDAFTGGFNLQIAWSTGRAAGNAARAAT